MKRNLYLTGLTAVILMTLLSGLLIPADLFSQNVILQPTKVRNSSGVFTTQLLTKQDRLIRMDWTAPTGQALDMSGRSAFLKIGNQPDSYTTLSIPLTGTALEFRPNQVGLAPGRYYARVTNATGNTMTTIRQQFNSDSANTLFSNEMLIIVEAPTAAFAIEPRGDITEATPTFSWEPVPGVVAYWVILSSTPFQIEDNDGSISITGVTGVWQYMTTQTSVIYGSTSSAFPDEPPPLNDGQEYSYTILNLYENDNPVFASPVFGGIIPFRYTNPQALAPPVLQAPANNAVFQNTPQITFRWSEVTGAANYTVRLSKRLTQSGAEVTIPIWTTTTTNTLIDLNAAGLLENTSYVWNVVANDELGRGTTSAQREFVYQTQMGTARLAARSAVDNTEVTGVEIRAVSTSGGSTTSLSILLQGTSINQDLVTGTYEFTATKSGFQNATVVGTISENTTSNINILMQPLQSSIVGRVTDENGTSVSGATVVARNLATSEEITTTANTQGSFTLGLSAGSYSVRASRAGYIRSDNVITDLSAGQSVTLGNNLIIRNDLATLSGFAFNLSGNAIQLARVTATDGNSTFEALTNAQGFYSFNLSSGNWTLRIERTGFVAPSPVSVNLASGDNVQNQNFTLASGANQVSGTVRRVATNPDGTIGLAPFAGVQIIAVPTVGNPVTSTTNNSGQYSLSLPGGTYEMRVARQGFTTVGNTSINLTVTETISGLDFELRPNPSSVTGRVLSTDGNPIAEAVVSVDGGPSVTTTASGTYTLSLPEGNHTIRVARTGFSSPAPRSISVDVGQTLAGIEFRMGANAGQISGRTTSAGQALARVTITARSLTTAAENTATSDDLGNYTLSLRADRYVVRATRSGFVPSAPDTVTIGAGQQRTGVNFAMIEDLARINGVITSNNTPLRNVTITITRVGDPTFAQSSRSLINGSFAFAVPAGFAYNVQASLDGFAPAAATTPVLPASPTPVTRNIEMIANPASVSGLIRNQNNLSVANVLIRAINTATGQLTDSTLTRTDGTYTIGLQPGNYQLSASRPGYLGESVPVTLAVGQNLRGIDFRLTENFARLQVRVIDQSGNPLEDVNISITGLTTNRGATGRTAFDGSFSTNRLVTGTYAVSMSLTGYIDVTLEPSLTEGQLLQLEQVLAFASGQIAGIVTDIDGNRIDQADVLVNGQTGTEFRTETDLQGNYIIENLPPDTYILSVVRQGFLSIDAIEVELTPDNLVVEDATISNLIPTNASVTGVVRNQATASPLQGVQVSLSGEAGSGTAVTAADGTYAIDELSPGSYTLTVQRESFRAVSQSVSLESNQELSVDLNLLRDVGRIRGSVLNQAGGALPVPVDIIVTSPQNTYQGRTNASGQFEITGVATGTTYTVRTNVFRAGLTNSEISINYPLSQDLVEANLTVEVREGRISGLTGTSETSVALLNAGGDLLATTQADIEGRYNFRNLAAGVYFVEFSKPGFVFSPARSAELNLAFNQTLDVNATATSNIGTVTVQTRTNGNPVGGVNVAIVGQNGQIARTGISVQDGTFRFTELPAGIEYTLTASRESFTVVDPSRTFTLQSGSTVNQEFNLIQSNATIAGTTRQVDSNGNRLGIVPNATIRARNVNTGVIRQLQSGPQGFFRLTSLPAGTFELTAVAAGFATGSTTVTLTEGQDLGGADIGLINSSVNITGRVEFRGQGIEGIEVQLTAATTSTTTTNASGNFTFNRVGVSATPGDTTRYQISFQTGGTTYQAGIQATAANIGQTLTVPAFSLPSGQIVATVTDGVTPLSGVTVTFNRVGGQVISAVTGADGRFASANTLRQNEYVLSYSRTGFLAPQTPLRITLASDTSLVNVTASLPYRHQAIEEILANRSATIRVTSPDGFSPSDGATATLNYRLATQSRFTAVNMTRVDGAWQGEIPALFSTSDITYFVSVIDNNVTYRSVDITRAPIASGILTAFRFTPQVDQQVLRVGETYLQQLTISDGLNQSLNQEFAVGGIGVIEWPEVDGITFNEISANTIRFTPQQPGSYTLTVSVRYRGAELTQTQQFTVVSDPITAFEVRAGAQRVRNTTPVGAAYAATDAQGRRQLLGNSLSWEVIPASAGTINAQGVFTASSDQYIGRVRIAATDSRTGLTSTTEPFTVFAEVRPERSYTFTNNEGMNLRVPVNAVTAPAEISVRNVVPEGVKKHVFIENSTESYVASERIYRFNLSAGSFNTAVQMDLPIDDSHQFNAGDKIIAFFDPSDLVWRPFNSTTTGGSPAGAQLSKAPGGGAEETSVGGTVTAGGIQRMGQFAVLARTEPLGLQHLSALPNPFSPDVSPVRIGYLLTTQAPPATVNILIFNMRGELVRTLLRDDLQQQGRYGSRAGLREITWDGLTDWGTMARNGRYVVRVHVRDADGEVTEMIPVVLVK
jgi:hypothetical protein